ncbi:MAG: hypothetical protein HYY84_12815 [Deltaproteobacteria bacterium]|nr:hypothetical protein [Deltaproteobacteria bacterium]
MGTLKSTNFATQAVGLIAFFALACGKASSPACGPGTHEAGGVCIADPPERPVDDAGSGSGGGGPAEDGGAGGGVVDAGPVEMGTIRLAVSGVPMGTDKLVIALDKSSSDDDPPLILAAAQVGSSLALVPAPVGGPYTVRVLAVTGAQGARRSPISGGRSREFSVTATERASVDVALESVTAAVAASTPATVVTGAGYTVSVDFVDPAGLLEGVASLPLFMSSALFQNGEGTATSPGVVTEVDATHRRLDVSLTAPGEATTLYYQAAFLWKTAPDGSRIAIFAPDAADALARLQVVPPTNELAVTVNGVPAGADRVVAVVDEGGLASPQSFDLAKQDGATTVLSVPAATGLRVRVAALSARRVPANDRTVLAGGLATGLNVPVGQRLPVAVALTAPSITANNSPARVAPSGAVAVALDVSDPGGFANGGTAKVASASVPFQNGSGVIGSATLTATSTTAFQLTASLTAPGAAGVLYYQARVRNDAFRPAGTTDSVTLYAPNTLAGEGTLHTLVTDLSTGLALTVTGLAPNVASVVAVIDGAGLNPIRRIDVPAQNGVTVPVDVPAGGPYRVRVAGLTEERSGTYAMNIVGGASVIDVTVSSGSIVPVAAALEAPTITQNATPASVAAGSSFTVDVTIKDAIAFSDSADSIEFQVEAAPFANDRGTDVRTTKTKVSEGVYRFTGSVAAPTAAATLYYNLKLESYNFSSRKLFQPTGYNYYTSLYLPDVATTAQTGALLRVDVLAPTAGLDVTLTDVPTGTDQIVAIVDRGGLTAPLKTVLAASGAATRMGVAPGSGYRLRAVALSAKQNGWYRSVLGGVTIENLAATAGQFTVANGAMTVPSVAINDSPATAKAGAAVALSVTVNDPGGFTEGSGTYPNFYVNQVPFANRDGDYVSTVRTSVSAGVYRFTANTTAPMLPGKLYYQVTAQSSEFRAPGTTDYAYFHVPNAPDATTGATALLQTTVEEGTSGVKLTPSAVPVGADAVVVVVDKGAFGGNEQVAVIPSANWATETTLGIPAGTGYQVRIAALSAARSAGGGYRQILAGAKAAAVNVVAAQFTTLALALDAPVLRENLTPVNVNVGASYKVDLKVYDPTGFFKDAATDLRTKATQFANGGGSYVPLTKTELPNDEVRFTADLTAASAPGTVYSQLHVWAYKLQIPGSKGSVYCYLPDVPDSTAYANLLTTTVDQLTNGIDITLSGVAAGTSAVVAIIDGGGLTQPRKSALTASVGATTRVGLPDGANYRVRVVALTASRSGYRQVLSGAVQSAITVAPQQFTAVSASLAAPSLDTVATPTTASAASAVSLDATLTDPGAFLDGATDVTFRVGDTAFTNGGGTALSTVKTTLTTTTAQLTATAQTPTAGALYYHVRAKNDLFRPEGYAGSVYLYAPDIAVTAQQTNLPKVTVN